MKRAIPLLAAAFLAATSLALADETPSTPQETEVRPTHFFTLDTAKALPTNQLVFSNYATTSGARMRVSTGVFDHFEGRADLDWITVLSGASSYGVGFTGKYHLLAGDWVNLGALASLAFSKTSTGTPAQAVLAGIPVSGKVSSVAWTVVPRLKQGFAKGSKMEFGLDAGAVVPVFWKLAWVGETYLTFASGKSATFGYRSGVTLKLTPKITVPLHLVLDSDASDSKGPAIGLIAAIAHLGFEI